VSDTTSTAEIQSKIAETRKQLENTLDSIEDRLNVPKQFSIYLEKAKTSYRENPTPWVAAAGATAASVVGLIVWAASSKD